MTQSRIQVSPLDHGLMVNIARGDEMYLALSVRQVMAGSPAGNSDTAASSLIALATTATNPDAMD